MQTSFIFYIFIIIILIIIIIVIVIVIIFWTLYKCITMEYCIHSEILLICWFASQETFQEKAFILNRNVIVTMQKFIFWSI